MPDLAIEIDLTRAKKPGGQQRVLDYLEAGVRLVWVIEPHSRTAMAYRPDGSARLVREYDALEGEDVVPASVCRSRLCSPETGTLTPADSGGAGPRTGPRAKFFANP